MGNIMVNDVCNMYPMCSYCFANAYVNGDTSTDISYSNFKRAVDWINNTADEENSVRRIGIIGGEPLVHPKLKQLLNYALMQRRPEQGILVFTNAIKLDEYADFFGRNYIDVLVNLNSPADTSEKTYETVSRNIALAIEKGVAVSLGINFYKADLNYDIAIELIRRHNIKNLRVGLVCPNSKEKRDQGSLNYLRSMKKPMLSLAEETAKLNCTIHTDCQSFPSCVLKNNSPELVAIRAKYHIPTLVLDGACCTPVIDIKTNHETGELEAFRCFGCSDRCMAMPLNKIANERDLEGFYQTNFDNLGKFIPANKECEMCVERNTGRCQGGCLSFKKDKIFKMGHYEDEGDFEFRSLEEIKDAR